MSLNRRGQKVERRWRSLLDSLAESVAVAGDVDVAGGVTATVGVVENSFVVATKSGGCFGRKRADRSSVMKIDAAERDDSTAWLAQKGERFDLLIDSRATAELPRCKCVSAEDGVACG